MAPHSSTLAWKTPRTEEPGSLQSRGSLRVRHDYSFIPQVHPRILKLSFACVCVYLASGVGRWGKSMSHTEEEGFTVGSAFQALQGLVLKLQWASESPRGLSKTQIALWAPCPRGLWPTGSGVRTETSDFKPVSEWRWWSWVSTTLWGSYTQDMWGDIQGCHKFIF